MLEKWAPDVFPEVDKHGRKHFGRIMMESAAETIRDAWRAIGAPTCHSSSSR